MEAVDFGKFEWSARRSKRRPVQLKTFDYIITTQAGESGRAEHAEFPTDGKAVTRQLVSSARHVLRNPEIPGGVSCIWEL